VCSALDTHPLRLDPAGRRHRRSPRHGRGAEPDPTSVGNPPSEVAGSPLSAFSQATPVPSSLLGRKKGLVVEEELVESVPDTEVAAESIGVYVPEPGRDQIRLVEEHIKQVHDDLISKESAIERLESTVEELRLRIGTAGEGETALNDNGDREIIKNTEDHLKDLHDEMKKTEIEIEEMEKMIEELGRKIAGEAQKDEEV
jgi:hypothetical protein